MPRSAKCERIEHEYPVSWRNVFADGTPRRAAGKTGKLLASLSYTPHRGESGGLISLMGQ
jgi:hypothetical protein